jgi:membrane associated rhomboid family serine protease
MFGNIPPVIKNLLLLNIVVFIGVGIMESKGIYLSNFLSAYPVNSPFFQPYQVISHMFLHADIGHIFFNMLALVIFGSILEKVWGAKRFFIFYFACGIGAFLIYQSISMIQIYRLTELMTSQGYDPNILFYDIKNSLSIHSSQYNYHLTNNELINMEIYKLRDLYGAGGGGASGAVFGVSAAFAILFPNTQLQLLFPPIPIRAKYLIGAYFVVELYMSFQKTEGDNVAHLAHVGGAIVGAILVLIWRRTGKNFY